MHSHVMRLGRHGCDGMHGVFGGQSAKALVGLGLMVGLTSLHETGVPARIRVLASSLLGHNPSLSDRSGSTGPASGTCECTWETEAAHGYVCTLYYVR